MRVSGLLLISAVAIAPSLFAGEDPAKRLNNASAVVKEMMHMDDKGVPQDLIDKAQCVVVVPGIKKVGFIVGAKYGKGFLACRKPGGGAGWTGPAAISIEGGSVGFQIGVSEQDLILLVRNGDGERKLLEDKFTIGGDATAAAGPVGRDLSAQTDAQLHAEILSYSRARGLFAGIALTGATLRPDREANKILYGSDVGSKEILEGGLPAPASAGQFERLLNHNSMHKEK
jgi:lipid-binding SYLF domain-containing protein